VPTLTKPNEEYFPFITRDAQIIETLLPNAPYRVAHNTTDGLRLSVNKETCELLELCDGTINIRKIAKCILPKHPEENDITMLEKVSAALTQLKQFGIVEFLDYPSLRRGMIISRSALSYPLREVFMEITHRCNLKCPHCYGDFGAAKKPELSTNEWKKVIDELASLNVLEIILSGGEPLLLQDFFEIVRYIRDKPMSVVVATNGTLIDEAVANELKTLKVRSVRISLDGAFPETHDNFRGVAGTYDKVLKAIQLLRERNIHIRVNVCLTKNNFTELPQMLQLIQKLGVDEHRFFVVYFTGRKRKNKDICFSPNDHKELEFIEKTVGTSTISPDENTNSLTQTEKNCGVGKNHLVIDPNGNVIPCLVFDREKFVLGKTPELSIKKIWENSSVLNALRSVNAQNIPKCCSCRYLKTCLGGCRARAYTLLGDIQMHDQFSCTTLDILGKRKSIM